MFKGATRSQRVTTSSASVAHLRTDHEMLSEQQFSRSSVVDTGQGNVVANTFISQNVHMLSIRPLKLVLHSEHRLVTCACANPQESSCTCDHHAVAVLATFDSDEFASTETLSSVKQRKREAECSHYTRVDLYYAAKLPVGK